MLDLIRGDVRYAVRGLRRAPGFASTAVLTLALAIGLVTALLAVVDAVLLQPIVPDQDRVLRISKLDTGRGGFPYSLSLPEFAVWKEQTRSFDVLAAVDHAATGPVPLAVGSQVLPATLAPVSADFFHVVHRGEPLLGRWLRASDERVGADIAAVVSERFWRRVSGDDPAFVGRRLTWSGNRTLVVVGVAPASVDYPLGTDLWAPAATIFDGQPGRFDARSRTFAQFELLGRLREGVTREQARAELSVIHRRVVDEFPEDYLPMAVVVESLLESFAGDTRPVLLALAAAAALVFVIASVNVAALLLMRAFERRPETTARIALGASSRRLLGQALAEGLALGVLSAACGVLMARVVLAAAIWVAPADVPRLDRAVLDPRIVTVSIVAALTWVLLLGMVPEWAHRRLARAPGAEQSRGAVRGTRGLMAFTVAEIAAAVIVAIGAGLFARTFTHLQAIERGFESKDLSMVSILLPEERQRDPRAMLAFYEQLLPQVEAIPGVLSASPTHIEPGSGVLGLSAPMIFEGQTREAAATNPWSTWEPVLPSYFRTLGIPVVSGREFTAADRSGGALVAIVSESVASHYWPGQDPIGRRLQFVAADDWPWVTVVGVAADTRYRELTKSWMTVYFPADQFFFFRADSLVVRAQSSPGLTGAVLQRVRAIEPGATIRSVTTMDVLLARELGRPLIAVSVTSALALAAIVLAAIGVYGVMSYEVRQRRREFAVRSAIGATAAEISLAVLRRSLIVGSIGAAIGLAVAGSATRALRSLLFGVQPIDAAVFGAGAAVLLAVVLLAGYIPARRAGSLDPVRALRAE